MHRFYIAIVTFFVTAAVFVLTACVEMPDRPYMHSYKVPSFSEVSTARLITRNDSWSGLEDNWEESCLYLNESFRASNSCTFNVQNGRRLRSSSSSDFIKLSAADNLHGFDLANGENVGYYINEENYQVGDVFYLEVNDYYNLKYAIVFEIVDSQKAFLDIRYRVVEFSRWSTYY